MLRRSQKRTRTPSTSQNKSRRAWGDWMEAGQDLLEYLGTAFPQATIALQLSALLPTYTEGLNILENTQARHLHTALGRGSIEGIEEIHNAQEDHIIMWAPPSFDTIQRTLGAYRKWQIKQQKETRITLLAPGRTPPSRDNFTDLTDLYTHPYYTTNGETSQHIDSSFGNRPATHTQVARALSRPRDP